VDHPAGRFFAELSRLAMTVSLGSYRAPMRYWGYIEPRWWRNHLHTHTFYEVCYAFAGKGTFAIHGKVHEVRKGQLFLAKPGEAHEIIANRADPLGIYFWAYSLVQEAGAVAAGEVDALMSAFGQSTLPVSDRTESMAQTCLLLTEESAGRRTGYATAVSALMQKLLLDTARAVVTEPIVADQPDPPLHSAAQVTVLTAKHYLRDNLHRPIGLRDLAGQLGLSDRHVARLFLAETGKTVIDFLIDLRMERATRMLMEHQQPIKQIAAAVGYPDVRYFTSLFHKRIGVTPAVFRKDHGTLFLAPGRHEQPEG
jgi:AraC-like DNA-binding protein